MAGKKISSFFSIESTTNKRQTSNESPKQESPIKKKRNNPSINTVQKWERELNITLGYKFDSDRTVAEIWCVDCRNHAIDRSSTIIIIYFYYYGITTFKQSSLMSSKSNFKRKSH